MTDICPDCGRDLTELNNSQWADYCHLIPRSSAICLPPPTEEELAAYEPILAPMLSRFRVQMSKTLDLLIQYPRLIDMILENNNAQ